MLQRIGAVAIGRVRAWRVVPLAALLGLLAACASQPTPIPRAQTGAVRYAPPASADDPWGPFIQEASLRFGVPQQWIREVMRQESGGQQYLGGRPITSPAGAMGLMQVMPETYEGLRKRYGLGNDPYDPHDNIMAGTGYLREMYDRFGSPNFLAAYNAGPGRVDDHLSGGDPLPRETVSYVASIAPRLGDAQPSDGYEATAWNANGGCDPLAAYDPNGPCATAAGIVGAPAAAVAALIAPRPPAAAPTPVAVAAAPAPVAPAPVVDAAPPVATQVAAADGCDPLAAYDPNGPCGTPSAPIARAAPVVAVPLAAPAQPAPVVLKPPAPQPVVAAAPVRAAPTVVAAAAPVRKPQPIVAAAPVRTAQPVVAAAAKPARTQVAALAPPPTAGRSGVQVGRTFKSAQQARAAADNARLAAQELLAAARIEVPTTTPFGGNVYYMARLTGLSPTAAQAACGRLQQRAVPCTVVASSAS